MKTLLTPKQLSKIILLFLAPLLLGFSIIIPERPEDVTSLEIQKPKKETYKIVIKSLKNLEYEVSNKVKFEFIEGYRTDYTIYTVAATTSGNTASSYDKNTYMAKYWLESVSEQKTRVCIRVTKQSIFVEGNKVDSGEVRRSESEEDELRSEIEKILNS